MVIDNRDELEDTPITVQIPNIDHCRRCWVPIPRAKRKQILRCNHCIKYVDAELNWWDEHPFDFYFEYHKSCNKYNVKDAESE